AWHRELRVRFVVLADERIRLERYPARYVRERRVCDGGRPLWVLTWARPEPVAHIVLALRCGRCAGGRRRGEHATRGSSLARPVAEAPQLAGATACERRPPIANRALRRYAELLLTCYDGY